MFVQLMIANNFSHYFVNLSEKVLVLTRLCLQSDVRSAFWYRDDNWLLGEGQDYPCHSLHIISLWSKSKVRD